MRTKPTPAKPSAYNAIAGLLATVARISAFQPPALAIFDRIAGNHAAATGRAPASFTLAELAQLAQDAAAEYADGRARELKP